MDQNNHIIKVINFKHQDVVTHPIIKLIGTIQNTPSTTCRTGDPSVHLYVNGATVAHSTTHLVHGKFKLLAELQEGENLLRIEHCCRHLVMELGLQVERRTRCVVPLYVVCHGDDGHFQAPPSTDCGPEGACRRITLGAKMLQCVTAEKMIERGLGRKTFDLEGDCRVFQSRMSCLEARSMKPTELWENIGREIMKSPIGSENKKYLAFLSCTRYLGSKYDESMKTHEDFLKITEGYVALGGGGLAIFGTACLYTWPEHFQDIIERFEDETPVDKTRFLDDSCYRGTLGACFSTTLGSVLHELYHTFDLGHTQHGIMGRGFDNIHRVFTKSDLATCDPPEAQRALREAIEFKEALEPSASASICRGENARKEFTVHGRFEEVDDTLLAENCAVILCYHKWFNCGERTSILTFDSSNKLVKSTAGVRVVEIRSPHTELVLHYWVFVGRVVKFSFQLPQEVIETCDGDYIVFVEDGIGSILKENVRI